jgi:hypothetical protein
MIASTELMETNMLHPKADKEKWTVYYIITGSVMRFHSESAATEFALSVGDSTPVRIIPPIYN